MVTGEVNPAGLEDLVRLCVELDRLRARPGDPGPGDGGPAGTGQLAPGTPWSRR